MVGAKRSLKPVKPGKASAEDPIEAFRETVKTRFHCQKEAFATFGGQHGTIELTEFKAFIQGKPAAKKKTAKKKASQASADHASDGGGIAGGKIADLTVLAFRDKVLSDFG